MDNEIIYSPEWCNTFECNYPICSCQKPKTITEQCNVLLEYLHWNVFHNRMLNSQREPIIKMISEIQETAKKYE